MEAVEIQQRCEDMGGPSPQTRLTRKTESCKHAAWFKPDLKCQGVFLLAVKTVKGLLGELLESFENVHGTGREVLLKYHNGFRTSRVASVRKADRVAGLVLAKR